MQVKSTLIQAGFQLVADDDHRQPGLQVTRVPIGALIEWKASDGFNALAVEQRGTSHNSMLAIVQTAVSELLVQHGHTVTEALHGALLVIANSSRPSDQ
ncbi:hypothetical protein [Streptomyces sp. NPDC047009]|uniref:hypothetical protein n=1 Tax=Streptomyces sp. NPDC047009 TaxID=3154496 RepID=UPI0033F53126